jgi:hypothetical protein
MKKKVFIFQLLGHMNDNRKTIIINAVTGITVAFKKKKKLRPLKMD